MTKINVPVREVPATPEEIEILDKKDWQKPTKPTAGILYSEYKLIVGIVIGCILMGVLFSYFQSRNFKVLNNNIARNSELGEVMEKNTETIKNLIEKNKGILEEYKANNAIILSEIEEKITRKTARVVESPEVQP